MSLSDTVLGWCFGMLTGMAVMGIAPRLDAPAPKPATTVHRLYIEVRDRNGVVHRHVLDSFSSASRCELHALSLLEMATFFKGAKVQAAGCTEEAE